MNESVDTINKAYEIHPLFGILVTLVIVVLAYLTYDTRSLRKELRDTQIKYALSVENKETQIRAIELKFREELSSMTDRMVKAYSEQTQALIKFEGLFRDLFNRDISKLNDVIAEIKQFIVTKSNNS